MTERPNYQASDRSAARPSALDSLSHVRRNPMAENWHKEDGVKSRETAIRSALTLNISFILTVLLFTHAFSLSLSLSLASLFPARASRSSAHVSVPAIPQLV